MERGGGARPAPPPPVHRQVRDVATLKQNAPGIGLEHARQQIDAGGLAGHVGADQRVARASLKFERKIARDDKPAELLVQPFGFQRDTYGASPSGTATTAFRPPSRRIIRFGAHSAQRCRRARPTSTIMTSTRPIQNCQYCGVMVENTSCSILNTTAPINPP